MRAIVLFAVTLMLSGCLITSKPVFNAANSKLAGDSPGFVKMVEKWEETIGKSSSPRELLTNGTRVMEKDGFFVVENREEGSPIYFAISHMGPRISLCFVHDRKIKEIAKETGVKVDVQRDAGSPPESPAVISADGPEDALLAFVIKSFQYGLLVCESPSSFVSGFR